LFAALAVNFINVILQQFVFSFGVAASRSAWSWICSCSHALFNISHATFVTRLLHNYFYSRLGSHRELHFTCSFGAWFAALAVDLSNVTLQQSSCLFEVAAALSLPLVTDVVLALAFFAKHSFSLVPQSLSLAAHLCSQLVFMVVLSCHNVCRLLPHTC